MRWYLLFCASLFLTRQSQQLGLFGDHLFFEVLTLDRELRMMIRRKNDGWSAKKIAAVSPQDFCSENSTPNAIPCRMVLFKK